MQLEKHVHHQHHRQTKTQTDRKGNLYLSPFLTLKFATLNPGIHFLIECNMHKGLLQERQDLRIYGFTICFWFLLHARNINRNHGLWKVAHRCRMKRYNGHPDVQVSAYQPNMFTFFFGSKSMCRFCTLRNLMRYQCLTTCIFS